MIYFDNAATTFPKPLGVEQAMLRAIRRYGANPGRSGHSLSLTAAVKVYECREAAANLFGAGDPANVAFTQNCTHALNLAIKGALRPGDHVIISDLEHNSVLRPVHALAEKGVITYSVARAAEDAEETLASFSSLIQPNTKMIACTHGSNVWGIRLPIAEIGRMCQSCGILFLVDAAQTAGVLSIDIKRDCIDFLCAAGHKGLYGPTGTGLLVTARGSELDTVIEGGTGTMSADYSQPFDMPERLESGTVNTVGIMGLRAGIAYVDEKTPELIYNHEMKLGKVIWDHLAGLKNARLYNNSFKIGIHLPIITFNIEGLDSEEAAQQLSDMGFAVRGGLHCSPLAHQKMGTFATGAVRISPSAFNTISQCRQLCGALTHLDRQAETDRSPERTSRKNMPRANPH